MHRIVVRLGGWNEINWWKISPRIPRQWERRGGIGANWTFHWLLTSYWLAIECTISMEILKFTSGNKKWDVPEIKMFIVRHHFKEEELKVFCDKLWESIPPPGLGGCPQLDLLLEPPSIDRSNHQSVEDELSENVPTENRPGGKQS